MAAPEEVGLEIAGPGPRLYGERAGAGPVTVCLHGLTATRGYVLHGSRVLQRSGLDVMAYDARGHGESDPAPEPEEEGYSYDRLVDDLERVVDHAAPDGGRALLVGHSMGAHTAAAYALRHPRRVAGLVLIGPVYAGEDPSAETLAAWDRLAEALERGGPEAFADEVVAGRDDEHRELLHRLALDRARLHRHPAAVAEALRQSPRSAPFGPIGQLAVLDCPTLVVASHDEIDSGHPYASAAAWAEMMPGARLVSEDPGASPLAWQGGRLSREIASFAEDAGLLGL